MKKTGIFYGSSTGTTADVARRIAKALDVADSDVYDVAKAAPVALGDYDLIIIGSSTWGAGELETAWYDFLAGARVLDLQGRKIAVFGCGDESMSDTFCDAVGELYDAMQDTGAEFIGRFNADGYEFASSRAVRDGSTVGLVLDCVNHPELSDSRIKAWTDLLRREVG